MCNRAVSEGKREMVSLPTQHFWMFLPRYVCWGWCLFPSAWPAKAESGIMRVSNYCLSRARHVAENVLHVGQQLQVFSDIPSVWFHIRWWSNPRITVCLMHNFLRERRSEIWTPPTLADWRIKTMRWWVWRRNGLGAFQNVEMCGAHNPTQGAKELREVLKVYFFSPHCQVLLLEGHTECLHQHN